VLNRGDHIDRFDYTENDRHVLFFVNVCKQPIVKLLKKENQHWSKQSKFDHTG
jgi:hypothetical protein